MNNIPVAPAVLFNLLTTILDNLGVSPQRVLKSSNLPQYQHLPPHKKIPGVHLYMFAGQAKRAVGEEMLFLKHPEIMPFASSSFFNRMISDVPNLYQMIQRTCQLYARASNLACFYTVENDSGLWWVRRSNLPQMSGSRQLELISLAYMFQVIQYAAGKNWRPTSVCLERESIAGLDRLECFAETKVQRNFGVTAVWISKSILCQINMSPAPKGAVNRDQSFDDTPPKGSVETMCEILRGLVRLGHPRIQTVAEIAGVNVRTLQRRLKNEDFTFKALIDKARFLESRDLLNEGMPLVDIAYELNYSDQAHFNHAFRRWSGESPGAYQLRLRPG